MVRKSEPLPMPVVGHDGVGGPLRLAGALNITAEIQAGSLKLTLDLRPFPPRDRQVISNRYFSTIARTGSPDPVRHAKTGWAAVSERSRSSDTVSATVCSAPIAKLLGSTARLRYTRHLLNALTAEGFRVRLLPLLDWAVQPDVPDHRSERWALPAAALPLLADVLALTLVGADDRPLRDRPGLRALLAQRQS